MAIVWNPSVSDVSGSIFAGEEIRRTEQLWNDLLSMFAPDWTPERSQSIMAGLLKARYQSATLEVIALARALHFTWNALTEKSVPVFRDRVRGLLNETRQRKFAERVAEFEASELLSYSASPIAFEPYVPESPGSYRPASTDYALRLPDCDVCLEVTVLRVGQLEARDRFREELSKRLRSITLREGLALAFEVCIPFEFDRRAAQAALQRVNLAAVTQQKHGELHFPVGSNDPLVLKWRPMQVAVSQGASTPAGLWIDIDAADFAGAIVAGDPEAFVGGALRSLPPNVKPRRIEELVQTSLQRTLRRKRTQYGQKQEPYVLIVKPGHEAIPPEGLVDLFERRIFNNRIYEWITGAGVLFPTRPFIRNTEENAPRLVSILNENATLSPSDSLRRMLNGTGRFHLRDGEFFDS